MNNKFALTSITLLESWLGHPKDSTININALKAEEMVSRGVAKYNIIEENKKVNDIIDGPKEEIGQKKVIKPPKDKMMRSYKNK